ncbi:MAG: hypothetical protein DMG13_31120 [Acidobacteria bacterium]|nr:MAG: hypothetical protein DMG13_31120 [Acidobacteriota bacterium]
MSRKRRGPLRSGTTKPRRADSAPLPCWAAVRDRAQTLLREALKLSPDERADVVAELLASIDDAATGETRP